MITQQQKTAWQSLAPLAHPPKDEAEYATLIRNINELLDETRGDEHHPLASLIDLLGDLALRFEEEHHSLDLSGVSPEGMLQFLMEQKGMTQKELEAQGFDRQGNISLLLRGKRRMTTRHIAAAARIFGVSPQVFFP